MSNTLLTPSIIAREALLRLRNSLVTAGLIHRGHEDEFKGRKVGDTITIRQPATFTAQEFTTTTTEQAATETSIPLVLEKHFDVTFALTAKDRTLSLQDFSEQLIAPAMEAIGDAVNAYVLTKYKKVPYFYEKVPTSLSELPQVGKVLDVNKVPLAGRNGVLSPNAKAIMLGIDAVSRAEQRGDEGTALREASIGRVSGIDWHMDQQVPTHTAGTFEDGAPAVDGDVAAGATTMDINGGSGSETIKEGDVFTVADVEGQYVFTADKTASGGEISGATFYPAAPTGGFPTGKAITIKPTHKPNLAFHKNAFGLAVVPLEIPDGGATGEYMSFEGMSVRVVKGYNISTKTELISLDLLCGAICMQPELATRIIEEV